MTLQEFTDRTGITVSEAKFKYIHSVYMMTLMEKDEFCEEWNKYADSKIIHDLHVKATNKEMENDILKRQLADQAHFLIEKSCKYNDPAMFDMAVSLIGKNNAVLYKLHHDLPLWDEDKTYLIYQLESTRNS